MKKYIILALISLMFTPQVFAETEQDQKVVKELEHMQDVIFSAPVTPLTEIDYTVKETPVRRIGNTETRPGITPLFKRYRIKIQNHFKLKEYEEAQKILEEERKAAEKYQKMNSDIELDENDNEDLREMTLRQLKLLNEEEALQKAEEQKKGNKFINFFKRKKNQNTENEELSTKEEPNEQEKVEQKEEPAVEKSDETLELSGTVKKLNAPKDAQLDCETLEYFEDRDEMEATGNPVLYFPPQDVTLKADKLVYNRAANTIKAYKNIELKKGKNTVYGDYIQINMNEETSLITNVKAEQANIVIHAEKVNAKDNQVELLKGTVSSDKSSYILKTKTRVIGSDLRQMMMDDDEYSTLFEKGKTDVALNADEITIDARKAHDVVHVKNGEILYNKNPLFHFSNMKFYTNKRQEYVEGNYPEFGSRSRIGMFIGPGFAFGVPNGGTVKLIPFLNYKGGIGVGGALKYRSDTNITEFMYGSANDIAVLRGRQQFDDRLFMQYGINSYVDDWFMGRRMGKYVAELVYQDGVKLSNFIGPKRDLTFKHRVGAGYIHDSDYNRSDEKHVSSNEMGTTRLKYMAEIAQSVYNYRDKENKKLADVAIVMQGGAAVYGTGDTQFIGRIGPRLRTQYKYWLQDIGYFQSAYQDDTPLPRFDRYRYGRSSVYLRESIRLNKYLAVAWSGTINLSDDALNNKLFQENAFMFAVGPDDFKVNLGYDFMRESTYFGVNIALDMKGTKVNYDKLVIKNPDRLGKNEREEVKEITFKDANAAPQRQIRTYAEVIEIEDPDREQIQ